MPDLVDQTTLSTPNPFHGNIVLTPWERIDVDVTEIHARAFEHCLRLVAAVQGGTAKNSKRSLLLNGPKGSGKTHLLARLCHHLTTVPRGSRAAPVVFAWVRLNTTAKRLWRHVRQEFVEDLLDNPREGESQLRRVLEYHVPGFRPRLKKGTNAFAEWLGKILGANRRADEMTAKYHELTQRAGVSAALRDALPQIYGDWFLEIRDFLRGGRLPDARLAALQLSGTAGSEAEAREPEEQQEDRARDVVFELCRLAGPSIPVVFCVDQIEALGSADNPHLALQEFGKLVSTLHDLNENVVIITSVQTSHIRALREAVREADWDRLAGAEDTLNLFHAPEAMTLIRKRLAGVDIPERKERQAQGEADWPFSEESVKQWFGAGTRTARDLLGYCADVFERAVHKRQPAQDNLSEFLMGNWVERLRIAANSKSPLHSDTIYRDALPLLASLWPSGPQFNKGSSLHQQHPDVDMIFETAGGGESVGICLCNQSMRWLPIRLETLKTQWDPKQLHKLVLLRDEGWPKGSGAPTTRKQLAGLKEAQHESLSAEEIIALRVFCDLLRSAESQGLLNGEQPVSVEEVRRWLHGQIEAGRIMVLDKARRLFTYTEFKK